MEEKFFDKWINFWGGIIVMFSAIGVGVILVLATWLIIKLLVGLGN